MIVELTRWRIRLRRATLAQVRSEAKAEGHRAGVRDERLRATLEAHRRSGDMARARLAGALAERTRRTMEDHKRDSERTARGHATRREKRAEWWGNMQEGGQNG